MEPLSSTYLAILALALLSGMTTLIGVGLAIYFGQNVKGIAFGIGFSAGIMLLISLFELIPEAFSTASIEAVSIAVVAGVLLLATLHWVIPHTHLVSEKGAFSHNLSRSAYLVALGLVLHDFPEGFAMANSFIASPSLGLLVAVAIAVHNIPEEFAMAVPIVAFSRKRFLFAAAFISGLAEPLGATIGLIAVHIHLAFNALFMAFAAGAMIYVSIHELLPMARIYRQRTSFLTGALLSLCVYLMLERLLP